MMSTELFETCRGV